MGGKKGIKKNKSWKVAKNAVRKEIEKGKITSIKVRKEETSNLTKDCQARIDGITEKIELIEKT